MNSNELISAIQQISEEKNISIESIQETIELALAAAYRKDYGNKLQNIKVNFNLETSAMDVFDIKTVVEDGLVEEYEKEQELKKQEQEELHTRSEYIPHTSKEKEQEDEEPEIKFNPKTMMGLSLALTMKPDTQIGEELRIELEKPTDFGRMAAQTAKQVIIQKIREAEREHTFQIFKDKERELINGMIQRIEPKIILVDIDRTTALLPYSEQIEHERYHVGSRMKFYIKEVKQTPKGPEIILSRNHPEIIRKLFNIEVPEISTGSVVIKGISREAGARSKIAVFSKDSNIDPIGACVGQRGARVQTIISELGGEKIDIIEYSDESKIYIAHALSPAKITKVEIQDEEKSAKAYVKEDQLSLAIGKGGQNVRLAARLTGWRIDIVEDTSGEIKMSSEKNTTQDETLNDQETLKDAPEQHVDTKNEKVQPLPDQEISEKK